MEDALLPPPRRPEATPLSNADFRQFLETPRREAAAPSLGQQQRQRNPAAGASQNSQKNKKSYKPRRKPEAEEKDDGDDLYRDRAEERRKGLNPDYDRVDVASATAADRNQLSVEDSKFLGGDVEHTHLVKGLDFALLQKVKEELVKPGTVLKARPKPVEKKQDLKFATPEGRAIYLALFNPPARNVSKQFEPRRSAFVYELDEDAATDVPTTLRRSAADCPPAVDAITATVDAPVLERLAKILAYTRVAGAGKPGKRLKRKDKLRMLEVLDAQNTEHAAVHASDGLANGANGAVQAPQPPSANGKAKLDEDGGDIFVDAGTDYKLQTQPRGDARHQDGPYFSHPSELASALPGPPAAAAPATDDDMELDEPGAAPPPPGLPPPPPALGGPSVGPSLPPADYDREAAYAQMHRAAGQGFEQYMQANIAYQASQDPEYQALLAKQAALQAEVGTVPTADAAAHAPDGTALTQQEREAGLASVFRREDRKLATRREADARERDPSYVSDAYAECYPGYHEYAPAVVDSDDEDLSHMDTKDKGQGRADFETEEQWQAYKSNKEAAPKAAFQFGVKVSDGRKGHKELGSKAREQKFNNQLNQIQRKLEKDGGDYSVAFAPAMEGAGGPSGAAKKRRI